MVVALSAVTPSSEAVDIDTLVLQLISVTVGKKGDSARHYLVVVALWETPDPTLALLVRFERIAGRENRLKSSSAYEPLNKLERQRTYVLVAMPVRRFQ